VTGGGSIVSLGSWRGYRLFFWPVERWCFCPCRRRPWECLVQNPYSTDSSPFPQTKRETSPHQLCCQASWPSLSSRSVGFPCSQNLPGPRSGVRRDAVGDHVTSTALQLTQGVKAKLGSLPDSPQSSGHAAEELLQGRDRRRSRLGREPCAAVGTFVSCLRNSPVQD
jgi:hypothetical protein